MIFWTHFTIVYENIVLDPCIITWCKKSVFPISLKDCYKKKKGYGIKTNLKICA